MKASRQGISGLRSAANNLVNAVLTLAFDKTDAPDYGYSRKV